ncbi:MAG: MBL fold metallo-hydrolase [Desulfomonile sp.]|nr:MBL fold metallo-hydrolase [Desulfomonile sp.]
MKALEVMENLFFIERGYLNGNHFVYRSDEPILIDTAYKTDFADTELALRGLGVELSRVRLIVNTHSHCDHVGGNRAIQELSGCDVAMHRIGKHFIDSKDDWSTWWRYYCQDADFFTCTRSLDHGDMLEIGPHRFEVIYTPGHASDGIVLYERRQKALISSDTLWENDMAVITERVEGGRAAFSWLDSLALLDSLEVRIVYPGHGRPFKDMHSAVSKTRKRLLSFLGNRKRIGNDLLKKIIVYTLMMKRSVSEADFFDYLMSTPWFEETVAHYFNCEYRRKFDDIMGDFLGRGIVKRKDGLLFTTVKP